VKSSASFGPDNQEQKSAALSPRLATARGGNRAIAKPSAQGRFPSYSKTTALAIDNRCGL
jgi:hypothetical protein